MSKKEDDRIQLKNFELIQEGVYGTHPKDLKKAQILKDAESSSKFGVKKELIEKTDFKKETLIYISSGLKMTGGYSIKVKRIYQTKKGNLDIYCVDEEPHGNSIGTMATTQPFCVIKLENPEKEIPKTEYDIVWMEKKEKK